MLASLIREHETVAYELGLLPSEFWLLTPAEFRAVADGRRKADAAREERANYRTAAMMAHLYNLNRGKGQPPKRAEDFLSRPARKTTLTRDEALTRLKILQVMFSRPPDRQKGGRRR